MKQLSQDYKTDAGFDPCEDHIGPFYYKEEGDSLRYAFIAEDRHCNTFGTVHGGVLMTFADFALCMQATQHYREESCVTVTFNGDFLSAGQKGDKIECEAEVTRQTGSMIFVRGKIYGHGEVIFTFSSLVKRLRNN